MRIKKEILIGLVQDWLHPDEFKVVENVFFDTCRWSIYYNCTIQDTKTGKFYDASYSSGATELQDESPFDYIDTDDEGNIELIEVEPYTIEITRYRKKE